MKRAPLLLFALAMLCDSPGADAQEAVYIVRHAERADQSADPPLSPAGAARARRLAEVLKDAGVTHVFTSNLRRTVDTAAPLAALARLRVEQIPPGDVQALAARVSALGGQDRVLVVGHSNTVPEVLRALHVAATITIADDEYDNIFIVVPQTNGAPTLLRLKY